MTRLSFCWLTFPGFNPAAAEPCFMEGTSEKRIQPLADPAGQFGGGGNWFDLGSLTYPQIRVSPRISGTLF